MRFVLDPPHGVGNVRLGTSRSEVADVLRSYGEIEEFRRTPEAELGWIVRAGGTTLFVYCDASGRVDGVEFARPADPLIDQVLLREINLCADPAGAVIDRLHQSGVDLRVDESGLAYTAQALLLGFWRHGGPEGPDGLPLYRESVLVARPDYYS